MDARLLRREALPFALAFLALVAAALLCDLALHALGWSAASRWLGIAGVALILASFAYSLRKRKLIRRGSPVRLLRQHEWLAWGGSLLVLVHAGVHFRSLLAWLALAAMLVNIASGLTGKFLLEGARRRVADARRNMQAAGLAPAEIDERLHGDLLALEAMRQWRTVHLPITLAFAVLGLAHIGASLVFWSTP